MELNQYNLYTMNMSGRSDLFKTDEVDKYIGEISNIKEYEDIKKSVIDKFGEFSGQKWVDYPEIQKKIYLNIEEEKVEVCALKNDSQYFGRGWVLVSENEE